MIPAEPMSVSAGCRRRGDQVESRFCPGRPVPCQTSRIFPTNESYRVGCPADSVSGGRLRVSTCPGWAVEPFSPRPCPVPTRRHCGRWTGLAVPVAPECAGRAGPVGWCSRSRSRRKGNRRPEVLLPAVLGLYGPVRDCPQDRRRGWPGARTYSGQHRCGGRHPVAFGQVRWRVEVQMVAGCKTVGTAYVGSNPTPATSFRRSEPVTLNGVTGFSAQNERLRKPSALFRGLCVGRVRPSPGLHGYRVGYRLTCGNTSGCGCRHAMLRAGQARRPWAVGGTGDWFAYM